MCPTYLGGAFLCGELPCLLKGERPLRDLQGRTMFNVRPYVPGFNVRPPADADVPDLNADGSVRTDCASSSRPPFYVPVGWTPNSDAYGNAETRPVEFLWSVLLE